MSDPIPPPPSTPPPATPVTAPPQRVDPIIALVVSAVLPGLAHLIFLKQQQKGLILLIAYVVCWFLVWLLIPLLGVIGIWAYAMYDAYTGAQKYNAANGFA